ncbi:MAG: hypothetical protein IJS95_04740 [Prevotella sp.]|nr:hypothetical protein [Prevotella sp.]
MKKTYQKPETNVVLMQVNKLLMASGDVQGNVRQYWTEDAEDGEYGL